MVDETDRMLRQAYQEWLPQVLAAAQPPPPPQLDPRTPGAAAWGAMTTVRDERWEAGLRGPSPRLRKLLLSATLTQDPSKIARLSLHGATAQRKLTRETLEPRVFRLCGFRLSQPQHCECILHSHLQPRA